jgi:hypothetical protein
MKLIPSISVFLLLSSASVFGMSVNFSAVAQNVFGDSSGNDLAQGSLIQIGTYESSIFSILGSAAIGDGVGFDGGVAFTTPNFDSTTQGNVGNQIAVRFFNSTTENFSDYGLILLDGNVDSEWFIKPTSTGPTPNQNQIELANLSSGDGTTLLAGASVLVGSFGPDVDSALALPLFKTSVVPEPSSFALLAGCFGLAWVMVRRRS